MTRLEKLQASDPIRAHFRMSYDPGDAWGSVMGHAFAVCDALYSLDEHVPDEWQYRPGLGAGTLNPDEDFDAIEYRDMIEGGDVTADDLREFGAVLVRWADILRATGKDY